MRFQNIKIHLKSLENVVDVPTDALCVRLHNWELLFVTLVFFSLSQSSQSLVLMWIGVLSFFFLLRVIWRMKRKRLMTSQSNRLTTANRYVWVVMRVTKRSTVSDVSCFCDMWLWLAGRSERSNERVAIQVNTKGTKHSLSFLLVVAAVQYCLRNTLTDGMVWWSWWCKLHYVGFLRFALMLPYFQKWSNM